MSQKGMIIIALLGIVLFSMQVSAVPVVEITPEMPTPKGTIEVTVTPNDDAIEEVYFEYSECQINGVCSTTKNVTCSKSSTTNFTASITLSLDNAAYLQYTIVTYDGGNWTEYLTNTKVDYDTSSTNGNGNDNGDNTPGFEFILLALSIMFISVMVYWRKR
jgi:hypothetical protein